jgi:hypothetical protein
MARGVRRALSEAPWTSDDENDERRGTEILDMILEVRSIPDAWRIWIEDNEAGWCLPMLVLEFLEVEVRHHISQSKMEEYEQLWWRLDGTEHFRFRGYRMDQSGIPSPFVTEDTIHTLMDKHRPDPDEQAL